MSRTTMTAAFAVMLAASTPMAFAQTTSTAPANHPAATAPANPPSPSASTATTNAPPANTAVETHLKSGQVLYSKMDGATVYDGQNNSVGDINNVVLDPNGKVAAVVIKSGGFLGIGGKKIAVGMNDLKMTTDKDGKLRFVVDMTKDQLKSAQSFDLSPPKTTESGSSTPPANRPAPPTTHR